MVISHCPKLNFKRERIINKPETSGGKVSVITDYSAEKIEARSYLTVGVRVAVHFWGQILKPNSQHSRIAIPKQFLHLKHNTHIYQPRHKIIAAVCPVLLLNIIL